MKQRYIAICFVFTILSITSLLISSYFYYYLNIKYEESDICILIDRALLEEECWLIILDYQLNLNYAYHTSVESYFQNKNDAQQYYDDNPLNSTHICYYDSRKPATTLRMNKSQYSSGPIAVLTILALVSLFGLCNTIYLFYKYKQYSNIITI